MPKSQVLAEGSLVAIAVDAARFAVGQILVAGIVFYIGVDPEPRRSLDEDTMLQLRLFTWTKDAELYHRRWKTIGLKPTPDDFPRPDYKFEQHGEMLVESFDGGKIRSFDPGLDQNVRYRWSVSPVSLSKAVLAINGNGGWLPHYDKFLA